eukprot:COSAG01_NODE_854_length_13095_cov_57.207525_6_plen_146_part_00
MADARWSASIGEHRRTRVGSGESSAAAAAAAAATDTTQLPPPPPLPAFLSIVLFGMMPCLADWLGSAGSFYLKPPTGNLGTRTAIRTTVRPQLAHGRDSQSRPNLSYRRLEVLAKFRPLAARGSAQLLNLVQLYDGMDLKGHAPR